MLLRAKGIQLACPARGDDRRRRIVEDDAEVASEAVDVERQVVMKWRDRKGDDAVQSGCERVWCDGHAAISSRGRLSSEHGRLDQRK
jgi:hypothetical protein